MKKTTSKIRRVITRHSEEGKPIIVSDSIIDGISLGGGKDFIQLWGNDSIPVHPDSVVMNNKMDWFPSIGSERKYE